MNGLIHAHSGFRWLLLLLLIMSIVNAFGKYKSGSKFSAKDKLLNLLTLAFMHTQALIGIVLYFAEGRYAGFANMGNKAVRFFAVEHLFGMLLAVIFVTIGYSKSKKANRDKAKFRKVFVWYLIALLIIIISIPWPFMEGLNASWF